MEYGVMVAQRILVPLIPVRIRIFQQLLNQNDMKQFIDIFADPIRKATARDCVVASVPILVPLLGIAAVIADKVVIYASSLVVIVGIGYLIRDLK